MKHPDMHTFTSAFEKVKHIHSAAHKATLREIVIAESLHKHAEYQEKKSILSFYSSCIQCMKNIKLIGATAAVILASTVAGIMAPSVMAQVAVNNGLDYLTEVTPAELEKSGYIISDINFEDSLTEAKNAKDLKVISEKSAIAEFSNEADMSMVMGKTIMPNEQGYVEPPKVEMIGNGTMEDPYRPKDGVTIEYQVDPRVTKYLQYTNPAGKKVTLGIDKNNLPIIMKVSQ